MITYTLTPEEWNAAEAALRDAKAGVGGFWAGPECAIYLAVRQAVEQFIVARVLEEAR